MGKRVRLQFTTINSLNKLVGRNSCFLLFRLLVQFVLEPVLFFSLGGGGAGTGVKMREKGGERQVTIGS